jgi:predicted ribonuclease YlaK
MLKQVLSRVGAGGKVVLAGDPSGQTYGINRSREGFKVLAKVLGKTPLFNYVHLNNVYRSDFVDYIDKLFEGQINGKG